MDRDENPRHRTGWRWVGIAAALGVVAILVWLWFDPGAWERTAALFDRAALMKRVEAAGVWGPVLIVVLIAGAVVASPFPSAPVGIVAGAVYGEWFATVLIAAGAELGAVIAFVLARVLGRATVERWLGQRMEQGLLGSQNALTLAVFLSRLMPFVSFDLMSYAAGLSCLHVWRFALATLAGILPASFVIAHVGQELGSGEMSRAAWGVLALGLVTGIPILWAAFRVRH